MKTALIIGVSGQDGAYLARLLLARGYRVVGTSRDPDRNDFHRLAALDVREAVDIRRLDATDPLAVAALFDATVPDEVYNLGGESSVAASFERPEVAMHGIVCATATLLDALRDRPCRFYSAGSSEMFGDIGDAPATETTPPNPKSPYAVAKADAWWQVANARDAHGVFAVTGILFNHDSRLRTDRFVLPKIVNAAAAIRHGGATELVLGDIAVERDWGWAPEYVDAIWRMLQTAAPRDYVVATGHSASLETMVGHAFEYFGLDWRAYVRSDPANFRPNELRVSRADPALASAELGWRAGTHGRDLIKTLAGSVPKPQ